LFTLLADEHEPAVTVRFEDLPLTRIADFIAVYGKTEASLAL
jgi:hypothetical protein